MPFTDTTLRDDRKPGEIPLVSEQLLLLFGAPEGRALRRLRSLVQSEPRDVESEQVVDGFPVGSRAAHAPVETTLVQRVAAGFPKPGLDSIRPIGERPSQPFEEDLFERPGEAKQDIARSGGASRRGGADTGAAICCPPTGTSIVSPLPSCRGATLGVPPFPADLVLG